MQLDTVIVRPEKLAAVILLYLVLEISRKTEDKNEQEDDFQISNNSF